MAPHLKAELKLTGSDRPAATTVTLKLSQGDAEANWQTRMKALGFAHTLSMGAAAAMLTACGGWQPQISATGAMPKSRAVTTHVARGGSWMLPEAKSGKLLYASDAKDNVVIIYSYPGGKQLGLLKGFPAHPAGLCSDHAGNVYVTTQGDGISFSQTDIYEYAHGGTTPIAMLRDPGQANGCSVDTVTGNLAVTNLSGTSGGNIAVYRNAQGPPTTYSDPKFQGFVFCTYDNAGNLFADGGPENVIDLLPKGGRTLSEIRLSQSVNSGSMQWARNQLVIVSVDGSAHGDEQIYNVHVSGSVGTVRGPTALSNSHGTRAVGTVQFWIQDRAIMGPGHRPPGINGVLEFWNYPKGGLATEAIQPHNSRAFLGVTVSLAK